MSIQLRQICLVASQIDSTLDDLTTIFGINSCYVDPGVGVFGLENNLMAIGRNFLEVVVPTREGTAGGRYLDRRGGDGGYMVICQIDTKEEQQAIRQRALDNGVRIAYERDGETFHLCQIHPGDMIAAFFEVDWDTVSDFNGYWHPVGGTGWEDKVKQDVTDNYLGVELQSDDPVTLAERWGLVAGLPIERDGEILSMRLHNVNIRFVEATDGRGPGLGGIDLAVKDRQHILIAAKDRGCYVSDDQVDVCGVRFYLHDV